MESYYIPILMIGGIILLLPLLFILGTERRYGGKIVAYFKISSGVLIFLTLLTLALVFAMLIKQNDVIGIVLSGLVGLYLLVRGYQIGHWLTIEGIFHLKTLKSGNVFDREKLLELRKQKKG